MNRRNFAQLIALLALGISTCLAAQAGPPKTPLAAFTQKDPGFTETITLFADGKYQQEEIQETKPLYHAGSLHAPAASTSGLSEPARGGAWYLLDKEGGVPISYKPGENFPAGAIIKLRNAMPFGLVWDNQSPFGMHGDRDLEAKLFLMTPGIKRTGTGSAGPMPCRFQ